MRIYLPLLLAMLLIVPPSLSAGPAADPENYKPSPFANDRLSLIGGGMMEHLDFGLGLFIDYERDPIVITNTENGEILRKVVGNHLTADLTLSFGVRGWLDLGIAIPAILFQDGAGWNDADGLPVASLGDLRFAMRIKLHETEKKLFTIALVPLFTFPTGRPLHDLSGSDGITFSPMLAMSIDSKWVDAGLDLYYRMTQNDPAFGSSTTLADQVGFKALVSAYAIPDLLSFNAEFMAATTAGKTFGEPAESPMEATLSVTWQHAPAGIALTAGAGAGIIHGFATPQVRAFAGVSWTLRQEKKAPPVPQEEYEEIEEASPEPLYIEEERKTVVPPPRQVVELDLAPKEKEEKKEAKREEKKPEPQKPAAPAPATATTLSGKPRETPPAPVAVAPAAKPAPAPTPPPPPKKPEPRTGTPWAETVYFKENSADFTDDSRVKLEKLNLLLSQNFTLKIRIEGHCDRNEKSELALKRAQAIKLWFVDRDIESKRIQTRGFGADEPVASSDLESDRARNRRVTFFMLNE